MKTTILLMTLLNFGTFYSQSAVSFNVTESSKFNISNLNYQGEIIHSKFWQDRNGENIVLFTRKEVREKYEGYPAITGEIFVFHYAIKNNNVTLLRKVYDLEKHCPVDMIINFIESSISVLDLDNDNYGEITFAYRKTCAGGVAPYTLNLLTLENGEKYIIRGSTSIDWGDGDVGGGKKTIDSSFINGPSVFISNANKIWKRLLQETMQDMSH